MPDVGQRSFKDVLTSHAPAVAAAPEFLPNPTADSSPLDLARTGLHKGVPAIFFNANQIQNLSQPFRWTLIGKFSQGYNKEDPSLGRPPIENLQKDFVALDLKGEFQLGLLDNRHVLIRFRHQDDYLRLYSRSVWYVGGLAMRI